MTLPPVTPTAGLQLDIPAVLAARDHLIWHPLYPGVDKHLIYETGPTGASAALLRYLPGAGVPHHLHDGHEHVLVLEGSQEDERGRYSTGTLVINPPGTSHRVWSPEGCLVLIVWERPVRFRQPHG